MILLRNLPFLNDGPPGSTLSDQRMHHEIFRQLFASVLQEETGISCVGRQAHRTPHGMLKPRSW